MPVNYIPHPIRATPVNVLGLRAYAVNYQNATLRAMQVIVGSQHTSGGVGSRARTVAYIDPAAPAAQLVSISGWISAPGIAGTILHGTNIFLVPAGWWYQIVSEQVGGGINVIQSWYEVGL